MSKVGQNSTAIKKQTGCRQVNAFWLGNEASPKDSSQNDIVPLLVAFHLPYSKYKGKKISFYLCSYQDQNFSLASHSCCSCSTRVAIVSFVSLVSHSCC